MGFEICSFGVALVHKAWWRLKLKLAHDETKAAMTRGSKEIGAAISSTSQKPLEKMNLGLGVGVTGHSNRELRRSGLNRNRKQQLVTEAPGHAMSSTGLVTHKGSKNSTVGTLRRTVS